MPLGRYTCRYFLAIFLLHDPLVSAIILVSPRTAQPSGEAEYYTTIDDPVVTLKSAQLNPKGRAELFAGEKCQAAISASNLSAWQDRVKPVSSTEHLEMQQQCYENADIKTMYVRNQKAASCFHIEYLDEMWQTANNSFAQISERYQTADLKKHESSDLLARLDKDSTLASANWFLYTFVGEPMAIALDAYLEVSMRKDLVTDGSNYYRQMPCDTKEQRTARVKNYFEHVDVAGKDAKLKVDFKPGSLGMEVKLSSGLVTLVTDGQQADSKGVRVGMTFVSVQGEPYTEERLEAALAGNDNYDATFAKVKNTAGHYGLEFFHSYPQALKVNVLSYEGRSGLFDAIGTVEDFTRDMDLVRQQAISQETAAFSFSNDSLPQIPSGKTTSYQGPVDDDKCADIDTEDPELVRMICELYRADYVCFGYELPAACQ